MLNVIMVQASEVKVFSMGYEVTYNCFFQEQMKALYQATVYESTYKPNVIMFHHVVPQCKSHMVSVTWRILIRCTRLERLTPGMSICDSPPVPVIGLL